MPRLRYLPGIFLSGLLAVSLASSALAANEDEPIAPPESSDTAPVAPLLSDYSAYLLEHAGSGCPDETLVLDAGALSGGTIQTTLLEDQATALHFDQTGDTAVFRVDVPATGLYCVKARYATAVTDSIKDIQLGISVDGFVPFQSADHILLKRSYKTTGPITQDQSGNDRRPDRELSPFWQETFLSDPDGLYNHPLQFWLAEGESEISVTAYSAGFALTSLTFMQPDHPPAYETYQKSYTDLPDYTTEQDIVYLAAEEPYLTSDANIYATSDRFSAATQPADPSAIKLNTIGQSMWKSTGQWICYRFTIKTAGYYTVSLRARQNQVRGNSSIRAIYLNDQLLFQEMGNIKFPYHSQWYIKTLGENEPYQIYLEPDTYTLRIENVVGDIDTVIRQVQGAVHDLNELYRDIIMITGTHPDSYRDYGLDTAVEGLLDKLAGLSALLREQYLAFEALGVSKGSDSAILQRLAAQMDGFIARPSEIANRLGSWQSNISSLSAWLLTLREQPLELDYIYIAPTKCTIPEATAGFWDALSYRLRSFLASFIQNYSAIGDEANGEAEKVWIFVGRDQAQILKDLIDNSFTPALGIPINLELVQTGLTEAVLAGQGPDVALMIDPSLPVNLAARNAIVRLDTLPGFQDILAQFQENASDAYWIGDSCYGLPVTEDFPMMFYRTDIFHELNITPPRTWNDFYMTAAVLLKNNMTVGISPDLNTFETLLYQQGMTLYNDSRTKTRLDEPEALTAMKQWTQFFSKYGFPQSFSFFNRFRTGEMPLGIQMYSTYNQLMAAAPEINGLWEMLPVPGVLMNDGSVNRCVSATGTAAVILNNAKDKEACWSFLKWFVSAQTQYEFGVGTEGLLGIAGRYNTANLAALIRLPWGEAELENIEAQLNNSLATPQIPASYYINRHLNNAFRKIVYDSANVRETLNWYNLQINSEITRKNKELSKHRKGA